MADHWNLPNSALNGEDEVGSTLEALVKLYCFHTTPSNEIESFLFGVQSVESVTGLMKRANNLLKRCQSVSPHLLPSHGYRMLYFFSTWLKCCVSKDITPDIKSRMALMMRLYEEGVSASDRENQRAKGLEKGEQIMTLNEILVALRELKAKGDIISSLGASKMKRDFDIVTYASHPKLNGMAEALTQLTIMAFRPVAPGDFFADKSPRFTLLANLFDRVSYWVATCIVQSSNPSKAISIFIMLGNELYKMENYDMLLAVLTGLGNIAITRLTRVWAQVSQKKVQRFQKLEEFMDPAGGYKNYRTKLREHMAGKPCVPYFALCLRDLTYIRDGSPTHLDYQPSSPRTSPNSSSSSSSSPSQDEEQKRLLNVRKIHLIGKCLCEFFEKLNLAFVLQSPDKEIVDMVRNYDVMDDDKLFSESLKKQPPPVDYDCFQLNPDFFGTIIIEKGIPKELAMPIADKLSELSIEELAALDRKSLMQLGLTKLRDSVSVLNSIHTAIGFPPFVLRPAHTWNQEEVIEWATLTEFDKSVVKKLKEKKIDGKALIGFTPEKVKELIPAQHRAFFQEHLGELQNQSGLALSLRTKLQTKMKKDVKVPKNFAPLNTNSNTNTNTTNSDKFLPLAGPRGSLIHTEDLEFSNTSATSLSHGETSDDCLTDDGAEGTITFVQIDPNTKKHITKATKTFSTESATLFKMRFFAKKKFGFKPSFYGMEGSNFVHIASDGEMSKFLKTKKKKMYLWECKCVSVTRECKCPGVVPP